MKLENAHRESFVQESWCYLKDSGDFLKKIKNIGKIPQGTILVTADVVGLCPNIPHGAGLEVPRKRLNKRETQGYLLKN